MDKMFPGDSRLCDFTADLKGIPDSRAGHVGGWGGEQNNYTKRCWWVDSTRLTARNGQRPGLDEWIPSRIVMKTLHCPSLFAKRLFAAPCSV